MASIGPSIRGTTDWTLLSGCSPCPRTRFRWAIHLTTNATGTVWHDGLLLAEVASAQVAGIEGEPMADSDDVAVWPVPAVVKVFQEDPPRRDRAAVRITAARNEQEPLQLAIRCGKAIPGVHVEVVPPKGPRDATLGNIEINVVGYVPIDLSDQLLSIANRGVASQAPSQSSGCDGWPGRWPDPLLPRDTSTMAANTTQAVWVTLSVPRARRPAITPASSGWWPANAAWPSGRLRSTCGTSRSRTRAMSRRNSISVPVRAPFCGESLASGLPRDRIVHGKTTSLPGYGSADAGHQIRERPGDGGLRRVR